ncbi:hypothetical protein GUJ93_ZPchr0013g33973 [Zizania palustris]|uniref:Uncharacterized protein n=1 Tax=Zizania palustris TaxID=103762 RepID=A0A8J6BU84_ZIZPA|nr:hypothetical protein GUJ93_ZPchr0013g33973 [Zizania palustris]
MNSHNFNILTLISILYLVATYGFVRGGTILREPSTSCWRKYLRGASSVSEGSVIAAARHNPPPGDHRRQPKLASEPSRHLSLEYPTAAGDDERPRRALRFFRSPLGVSISKVCFPSQVREQNPL